MRIAPIAHCSGDDTIRQRFTQRHRSGSIARSTARPRSVRARCPRASRVIRPLTTIVVTISPGIAVCFQSVLLATQIAACARSPSGPLPLQLECSVSPLRARQARALGLLSPVWPRVGADDPAASAHNARPEARHRHVVSVGVDVEPRRVVAHEARHRERPHAKRAHICERHRRARLGSWLLAHGGQSRPSI